MRIRHNKPVVNPAKTTTLTSALTRSSGLLLLAGILAAGCAGPSARLSLAPVGPPPGGQAPAPATGGSLVVYSACESIPNLSLEVSGSESDVETCSDNQEYSAYEILSADGKHLRKVQNNAGTVLLHPQQVALPAGKYTVSARSFHYGRVAVPVVIAAGQTTVLHLEGESFWPAESGFNQTNTVRLPDGQVIGWRALAVNEVAP